MFTFSLSSPVSESAAKSISEELKSLFTKGKKLEMWAHVPSCAIIDTDSGEVTGYRYPARAICGNAYMDWDSGTRSVREHFVRIRKFGYV